MKMKILSSMALVLMLLFAFGVSNVWAADTIITVKLQDSDTTLLTGGSLRYYDGSWQTDAVDNLDGTFTVTVDATCLLYTSPSPRDGLLSRMPSSA